MSYMRLVGNAGNPTLMRSSVGCPVCREQLGLTEGAGMDREITAGTPERGRVPMRMGRPDATRPRHDATDVPKPDETFPLTAVMVLCEVRELLRKISAETEGGRHEARRARLGWASIVTAVWLGVSLALATMVAGTVIAAAIFGN